MTIIKIWVTRFNPGYIFLLYKPSNNQVWYEVEMTYVIWNHVTKRHRQLAVQVARLPRRGRQVPVSWRLSRTPQTVPAFHKDMKSSLIHVRPQLDTVWFCLVFSFVSLASLSSASFWVISTSQRLRKLTEFWDHFISLHLCSLCSSFFWYVYVYFFYSEVI